MVEADDVLSLASQIPKGSVSTYRLLAEALGRKTFARFVGMALSRNPNPVKVPCHRIVRSDGHVGGYKLGVVKKIRLLREEGVEVKSGMIAEFKKHLFKKFITR